MPSPCPSSHLPLLCQDFPDMARHSTAQHSLSPTALCGDHSLRHAGPPLCRGETPAVALRRGMRWEGVCGGWGSTGQALPERDVVFNVVRN